MKIFLIAGGVVAAAAGMMLILSAVRAAQRDAKGRPVLDAPKLALGAGLDSAGMLAVVYALFLMH